MIEEYLKHNGLWFSIEPSADYDDNGRPKKSAGWFLNYYGTNRQSSTGLGWFEYKSEARIYAKNYANARSSNNET